MRAKTRSQGRRCNNEKRGASRDDGMVNRDGGREAGKIRGERERRDVWYE